MADVKGGAFDIPEDVALAMLASPNPDGRSNADVVRPWVNGLDITRRPRDMWIIDFGVNTPIEEAMLYEAPFEYVKEHVKPIREQGPAQVLRDEVVAAREPVLRDACGPRWPAIASSRRPRCRSTDSSCGCRRARCPTISSSSSLATMTTSSACCTRAAHELWARGLGTQLREVESGFRYTPTSTFETFPFPAALRRTRPRKWLRRRGAQRAPRRLAESARAVARRVGEAHADESLQLAAHLAHARARAARPRRPRRLRLAAPARRRRGARAVARAELGASVIRFCVCEVTRWP